MSELKTEKTLYELLPEVMREVGYVQKQKRVELPGGRGYKYASLEQILEKVNEALASRGICVSMAHSMLDQFIPVGEDGKRPTLHAVVTVSLTFRKGDQEATFFGTGSGADSGDKAVMKASSAACKYALQKAFLISWGDDPEADTTLYQGEEKPAARAKAPVEDKKPRRAGGRAAQASIEDRMAAAETIEQLEGLRPEISALRPTDKPRYEALKKAYGERAAALRPSEAPQEK